MKKLLLIAVLLLALVVAAAACDKTPAGEETTPADTTAGEAPTEDAATETPTEDAATETPTEDVTTEALSEEATTEAPVEDNSTEPPTETPTETPTEKPTETPTEEPTETPSEEPTDPADPADPNLFEGNTVGQSQATSFNFGNNTSINLWFWADSFSDGFNAFFAKATKDTGRHYEVYTEAGFLKLYAPAANGGNPIPLNLNMRDYTGMWHMLTLVHTGGQIRVYMDGLNLYSSTADFELEIGEDLMYIGQIVEGGMEFDGRIVGVELVDRALTADEVGDLYEAVMGERPDTGDEIPGLEGNDVGSSIQTDFSFGDGTSINLWFNPKGFGDFAILLAKSTKDTGRHFEIYCQGSSLLFYAPAANGNNPIALNLDLAGCVGTWHMLTLVHTDGQLKVYLDGTLCHTADGNFTLEGGADTLYYGQLVEGIFPFNGQIVKGELLNEALTDEAVAARYNAVVNG